MKLSDTQLVILSAASQRENRHVLPLPRSLKGGAASKVMARLIANGLVEEINAKLGDERWRDTGEGRGVTLVLTDAGLAALEGDTAPTAADTGKKAPKAAKAKKVARVPPQPPQAAKAVVASRPVSKQAQLIAMLKQPKGASIEEIVTAFGWQPHTVRGAISGALKKKLGLTVTSEKFEDRGRVYRMGH